MDCFESPKYYNVNLSFGEEPDDETDGGGVDDSTSVPEEVPQMLLRRVPFRQ